MYGLIFTTVKDLVLKKFGEAVWLDLLAKAGLTHDFVEAQNYEDGHIYTLLTVASRELNTTVPELLEAVGYWFPIYVKTTPYGKVLSTAGNSLKEILTNINTMHGHIKVGYFSEMHPPTFRVSREKENGLYLHYLPGKPTRKGLSPLLVGIIKSLGEDHLGLTSFKIKQKKWIDKGAEEDVFVVKWKTNTLKKKAPEHTSTTPISYGLDPQGLDKAFPFHFIFNQKLDVLQCGKSLSKIVPMQVGDRITNHLELIAPATASFSDWKFLTERGRTEVFIFQHAFAHRPFKLKGQLLWQAGIKAMCFVGTPLLGSLEELDSFGLGLSDFAAHDPTKDALFLGHAKTANLSASAAGGRAAAVGPADDSEDTLLSSSAYDVSFTDSVTPSLHSSSEIHVRSRSGPESDVLSSLASSSGSTASASSPADVRRTGGCPFSSAAQSASSASTSSLPALKTITPSNGSPAGGAQTQSPPPIWRPASAAGASLLDKLFGSRQKSSYRPAASGDKPIGESPRPQGTSLRALLSGHGLNAAAMADGAAPLEEQSGSGRKRSKSCSDSDEVIPVVEDLSSRHGAVLNTPTSPRLDSSRQHRRAALTAASGATPLRDDEQLPPRLVTRLPRTAPAPPQQHQQYQAIPSAGPVPLPGRQRLENAFQELLLDDARQNYKLVMEMLQQTYAESGIDDLVCALLEIYNCHGKSINFLRRAIELDVRSANEEGVLMRSETVGTRVLSLYMRRAGKDYISSLVNGLSAKIAGAVAAKVELLPGKAPSDKHTTALLEVAQSFLEETCRSSNDCPVSMRRVLRMVGEEVAKRWPQMKQQGILNLLFLRLLTPAILSTPSMNDLARRVQLLVTKLIQNLANDVPFDGRKEEHMKAFNVFITDSNQTLLRSYVASLTDEESIHETMNQQARANRSRPTPAVVDYVAMEEALSVVRDGLIAQLDPVWKVAATDDHLSGSLRRFMSVGLCQMYSAIGRT